MAQNNGKGVGRREVLAAGAGIVAAAGAMPSISAQAQAKPGIVDFHNHFIGPKFEMTATGTSSGPAGDLLKRNMTDEGALVGSIGEAGIAARVINTPTAFLEDKDGKVPAGTHQKINEELAALQGRHKGRLIAMATVDAYGGEASAKELQRAVKQLGLRGVFVESGSRGLLLDAEEARPTLQAAAELGVPVFVHPVTDPQMHERFKKHGRNGIRLARATINSASLIAMLEGGVFEKVPKLNVVVTTLAIGGVLMAGGFGAGMNIRADAPADKRRHVYIDTMGLHPALVSSVVALLGADHVLMGTDWPIVVEKDVPARLQKAMDASGLDAASQALLAGGNTMRLLGLA